MGVTAVLFDLDNTLIDFMRMKNAATDAALTAMVEAGLGIGKDEVRRVLEELWKEFGIEYQQIYDELLRKLIGRVDYKILASGIIAYRRAKEGMVEPYPGVVPMLIGLKKRGYKLGVLSDAPALQAWTRLVQMRIADFFDVVVTFDDTGRKKPDRAPFRVATERLGAAAENILFVGDDMHRDIAGAKLAGMRVALATYGIIRKRYDVVKKHKTGARPDFRISSPGELLKMLPERPSCENPQVESLKEGKPIYRRDYGRSKKPVQLV